MPLRNLRAILSVLSGFALVVLSGPVHATWSIVVVNTDTGEVCVATATCLPNTNIQTVVPLVQVGHGAAAAQFLVTGSNKPKIWNGFLNGDTPEQILANLAATDPNHQARQYGIVDLTNDPTSFTGTQASFGKNDLHGVAGRFRYAVQGNSLTGQLVVQETLIALLNTPGDTGERVMAAMEAARVMGGDGRCSCSFLSPTSCGVPPPSFNKSAHAAAIVLARFGDQDGVCTGGAGCANGSYYLELNVTGNNADPDPVLELQGLYDVWRAALAGRPDHVLSTVASSADLLPADGASTAEVTVRLVDVEGAPLTQGGAVLTVSTTGLASASPVTDNGDGSYVFEILAGLATGEETVTVVADDGAGLVQLHPPLTVQLEPAASLHAGFDEVSSVAGADVPFVLDFGPEHAGEPYALLASASGTVPGLPLGGATLPLEVDAFTFWSLAASGPPVLPGSVGALDAGGRAGASFVAPPGLLAAAVGARLDWAAVAVSATLTPSVADGFEILP